MRLRFSQHSRSPCRVLQIHTDADTHIYTHVRAICAAIHVSLPHFSSSTFSQLQRCHCFARAHKTKKEEGSTTDILREGEVDRHKRKRRQVHDVRRAAVRGHPHTARQLRTIVAPTPPPPFLSPDCAGQENPTRRQARRHAPPTLACLRIR